MSLYQFYRSQEWEAFRKIVIMERLQNGETICEHCGRPIVRPYDLILHHMTELTEENYRDSAISLNPSNIQLVHHACHNRIHNKGNHNIGGQRQVFVVYGAPLSGKTSFVKEVMNAGDLVIDIDSIWECLSGQERYIKPNRLKSNVFGVRDTLIDQVRHRVGKWNNAYIIGGYPYKAERDRLIDQLGAREIYIECEQSTCIDRLMAADDGRDVNDWTQYITDWFSIHDGGY